VLKAGLNIISLSELSRDFRKNFQNKMRPTADDVKSQKEESVKRHAEENIGYYNQPFLHR